MADEDIDTILKELRPDVLLKEMVPPPPHPREVFENIFGPKNPGK